MVHIPAIVVGLLRSYSLLYTRL